MSSFVPPISVDIDSSGKSLTVKGSLVSVPPSPPPPPTPSPIVGNFGSEWFYQPPGGGATGSIQQVDGVLQTRLQNPGGDDSNYGYVTAQRGDFPWGSAGGTLRAGITSIVVSANILAKQFGSGSSHVNVFVALYFKCPSAFNGWFDTQVRVEWVDRVQSSDGSESQYGGPSDPSVQGFGYSVSQTSEFFNIDVEAQFRAAAQSWGIDPSSSHSLAGVEIGPEGFGVDEIDVDFLSYAFITGPITTPPPITPLPLSAAFHAFPSALPLSERFAAAASGGVPPYSFGWDFGDGVGSTFDTIQHSYVTPGDYTITLTVTDATLVTTTVSQSVTISATPPPPLLSGPIEQVVVVIFENTGLPTTMGVPGFAAFANANALSTNWSHLGHPSEPNYVGISFGDMMGVSSDSQRPALPGPTILDLVRASGRTFKVIQNGDRDADHNGFRLESPDISNTMVGDSSDVVAAVDAGVNFVWFTPSDQQNAHDNGIDGAWDWFNNWLPQLQAAMAKRNSLLILTFDESFDDSIVYTVFAGPAAKKGYSSNAPYNHYSFGRLFETIWGGSGLRNCDSAADPSEFFR